MGFRRQEAEPSPGPLSAKAKRVATQRLDPKLPGKNACLKECIKNFLASDVFSDFPTPLIPERHGHFNLSWSLPKLEK
jgi:hypothetical protein